MEKTLEEVEYCKAVIKKHFNKPLVMTEVDEQNFKTMDGCHVLWQISGSHWEVSEVSERYGS